MKRFIPLDILRGLTVALMIIVNNPGSWSAVYAPLRHSPWNGCTPTDLVFPFFLFCVGMAMAFSLAKYDGLCKPALWKVFRRTILIILLGLFLNAFPFNHLESLRFCGVLQRIGLCYFLGAILVLWLKKPAGLGVSVAVLLALYTAVLLIFGDKGAQLTLEGNVSAKIDVALFGSKHVYHGYGIDFDPEGPLGTLSATCNVLLGWLVGWFVKRSADKPAAETTSRLFVFGLASLVLSQVLSIWIPINKPIWSASYVFFTCGWATVVLGVIMFFTEIKGCTKAFKPAIIFGSNAITAFFLSAMLARIIGMTGWDKTAVFNTPALSLLYAILYAMVLFCINWLLYKKKIYIKL